MDASPSEPLRAARRSLEGLLGITHIGQWRYYPRRQQWGLKITIRHAHPSTPIPSSTNWHLVVDPTYPFSPVALYPDQLTDLPAAFPHQRSALATDDDVPWRGGNVCASTQFQHFGRTIFTEEPWRGGTRLRWYGSRLVAWVEAAATSTLVTYEDPFERPVFDSRQSGPAFAFHETPESYQAWQRKKETAGIVELVQTPSTGPTLLASRFLSRTGKVVMAPSWPERRGQSVSRRIKGAWLRLPGLPVLEPYQTPRTWVELAEVSRLQGSNVWSELKYLVEHLRGQESFIFLLGYPIKERVGDDWSQLQWQSGVAPALCTGHQPFGQTKLGHTLGRWLHDRQSVLADAQEINWRPTKNWAPAAILARGRLSPPLNRARTLLIGAGSLGSLMAEQLVRGGVADLTVIDPDVLEVGNLVRHTLTLDDLGRPKAQALADRLNHLSPNTAVSALTRRFSPQHAAEYQPYDLVIDTTGSDEILYALEAITWDDPKTMVSVSVGLYARRLFFYARRDTVFAAERALDRIEPQLAAERESIDPAAIPREEVGCWNPVFPARSDDMWLMVSAAVKELTDLMGKEDDTERFVTYEQQFEGERFVGITRVER